MLNCLLSHYFCEEHNIDSNATYEIEKVNAKDLIVKERIDLIAKLKYIEFREKGYDLTFVKEVYAAHIEAFSEGTFTEPGNDNKNSIEKYFETFDSLIDDIKKNGIDETISVIPVGSNNAIMDGAHRVSIAAYFNMEVPIIRFDNISATYDVEFFRKGLLDEQYIDYLVTEYCKMKENIYFACIWPRAKGSLQREKMDLLINETDSKVFKKNVKLNNEGLSKLVTQIYSEQDWIGNIQDGFLGAKSKADACYDKNEIVTTYILECDNFEEILQLKKNIRDIFQIENSSIHITDTKSEAVQLSNLLLNQNSINFLNTGNPYFYKRYNSMLSNYKKGLIEHDFSLNDFIIDSSSTLAMYGLREANDIDFVTISDGYEIIEDDNIQNHHKSIKYYDVTIENLLFNPQNYFVYNDLKFVTLDVLRAFKKNRNEIKDQYDVKLIDRWLFRTNNRKLAFYKWSINVRRVLRNKKVLIMNKRNQLLRKLGMYEGLKKTYHYLKGLRE